MPTSILLLPRRARPPPLPPPLLGAFGLRSALPPLSRRPFLSPPGEIPVIGVGQRPGLACAALPLSLFPLILPLLPSRAFVADVLVEDARVFRMTLSK